MSKWTELAIRVQSLAQGGLAYSDNSYDRERYEELREIAAQMLSCETEVPTETIKTFFCNETGYQTPKVDTRAAVFQDGRLLLVHERNGTWSLPGGWCDVDQSVAENTVKETLEEAGLRVSAGRLIAVQDRNRRNPPRYAYGVVKIFVLCTVLGGSFRENLETTESRWFSREELPENLAEEKVTKEQLWMCFDAKDDPNWQPVLD